MSEQETKHMLSAIFEAVQVNNAEIQALKAAMQIHTVEIQALTNRVACIEANMVTKAEFTEYVSYAHQTVVQKADLSIFATKADLLAMEGRLLQRWYAHEQEIQHLKQNLR